MRMLTMTLAAALAIPGCRAAGPDPQMPAGAAGHSALVAGLDGAYVWDCSLNRPVGSNPPQFVLHWRSQSRRDEIQIRSAGQPGAQNVGMRRAGFARIFTLRDRSAVLIAADGSVYGVDARGRPIGGEIIGTCRKGGQTV